MKSKFVKAGIIVAGFWCGTVATGQETPAPTQSEADVYQSRFEQLFSETNQRKIIPIAGSAACCAPNATAICAPPLPGCAPANAAACNPAACGPAGCGPAAGAPAGCNGAQGCNGAADPAAPPCETPWTLMELFDNQCGGNWLRDKGVTLGGWLELGFQNEADGSFTGNGPFLDDAEWRALNTNQLYVFAEKIADGSKGIGWGFRADVMYGVDGNEGQAFGNVDAGHWDFLNGWDRGIHEFAMPQLYGEFAIDKLAVKVGHFYTPTGYEVVPPLGNFFFSRQITWYQAEPFTHTGALATYKATDKFTVQAGWALGWDTGFYQFDNGSIGLLNLAYNPTDKTSLVFFSAFGNSGWRGDGHLTGAIVSHKWTEKWMSVHQVDIFTSDTTNDFKTDGIAGDSTAFVNYLFYEISAKWKAGVRSEWWKADGVSYNTFSYGVNYKPRSYLTIRPEIRHLWSSHNDLGGPAGSIADNVANVYGNNTVIGVDAVFTF